TEICMRALILGRGNMGRAIRDALAARGDEVVAMVGRSGSDTRPSAASLAPVDVAFEFSHGEGVASNVRYALDSGCRAIVLGTTAPEPDTLEIVSLRAGASPGMHVVGFDSTGESIELRITARDRSAYVAGALLAADWLRASSPHPIGLVRFETVVRSVLDGSA